jgi:predicted transcriptional regulator
VKIARTFRLDESLVARLDGRASELGQSRTVFVERALEAALEDYSEPMTPEESERAKAAWNSSALERQMYEAPKGTIERTGEVVKVEAVKPEPPKPRPPVQSRPAVSSFQRAALDRQQRLNKAKGL